MLQQIQPESIPWKDRVVLTTTIRSAAYGPAGPVGTNPLRAPVASPAAGPVGPVGPKLPFNTLIPSSLTKKPPVAPKAAAEPVAPVAVTAEVVYGRALFEESDSGPCGIHGGSNPCCAAHDRAGQDFASAGE
jgi:hypothetical protein